LLSWWDIYSTPCPNDHPEILFVKILVCVLRKIVIRQYALHKMLPASWDDSTNC
jgi:hypothetical protein